MPAFVTTQAACCSSVASVSRSVKLGSCTAAPSTPSAAANRSRQRESRGCGRKRSEKRASAPLSRHQATSRAKNRSSCGVFVGVFPITITSGRVGSSP